ncbi:hypothetical protein FA95DRAFT_144216 [Auriscalpium vulgare]|uniref:Uncharacterized protein n=1 Tax=Auriscalpium vulgare TaxID=40419 RepID=A0ACB8S5L5_9AGAM|nr:hypothetical protein FA95DRAFT_144216 [Auriscalpium vulgare]
MSALSMRARLLIQRTWAADFCIKWRPLQRTNTSNMPHGYRSLFQGSVTTPVLGSCSARVADATHGAPCTSGTNQLSNHGST